MTAKLKIKKLQACVANIREQLVKLPESLRNALREEESYIFRSFMHWWFVWDRDEWVGYAGVSEFSEGILYLGPTFIKPSYRGQGLQRKLIKKRLVWAKKSGYSVVRSTTLWLEQLEQ